MANETSADISVKPSEKVTKFRRIITGHDASGKAVFVEDKICGNAFCMGGNPDFVSTEIWRECQTPADNSQEYRDPATVFELHPPKSGNVFRILEIPPLHTDGSMSAPLAHRTPSLDYAVVLKGEGVAILEDGVETVMKAGDILIQRGTVHAWDNRSDEPVVILFVLCGAENIPGLPPM